MSDGSLDSGGTFYTAMNVLQSQGFSSIDGKGFTIQAMSRAFFHATSGCSGSGDIVNAVNITCSPTLSVPYDQTSGCLFCQETKKRIVTERLAMEKEAALRSGGSYTAEEMSSRVAAAWSQPGDSDYTIAEDVCRNMCEACIVEGVEQNSRVHMDTACSAIDSSFITRMQSSLKLQIQQELATHSAAINKLDASLDTGLVDSQMTDRIQTVFQESFKQDLVLAVIAFQELEIEQSESIVVSRVSQSISASVVESIASRIAINVDFYNSDEVTAQQKVMEDNSSGLSELRDSVVDSVDSLNTLWTTLEGRLIIIAVAIFLTVVVGLVALLVTRG